MSRMVQVRTYGMHGFVAVGNAHTYAGATVPTEHLYLSHAFALWTYVRISVVRRLARTWPGRYVRTYVRYVRTYVHT